MSSGIVVGDAFAEERPETVEKFLAALEEAVEFSNEDTDAAVQDFLDFDSDSQLAPEQVAEQWRQSMDLHHTDANEGEPFGCMASDDWESTISLMEQYGDVSEGSVSMAEAATNSFLPQDCSDELSGGDA